MPYEKSPNYINETPGKKCYCTCGASINKPCCNGSHKKHSTRKSLKEFEVSEAKRVAICDCGYSEKSPLCDGTHSKL